LCVYDSYFTIQVETVAQFGVIFLLFALGLEFSTAKVYIFDFFIYLHLCKHGLDIITTRGVSPLSQLRVVRAVAVVGGLLQIILFMLLCGISATLCGGKTKEGVFVGVLLSMSSTAVVLKFLMERNSINALHGQVTVGTLILQV
jgi:Kef-type K+ transport system membrane component KefB